MEAIHDPVECFVVHISGGCARRVARVFRASPSSSSTGASVAVLGHVFPSVVHSAGVGAGTLRGPDALVGVWGLQDHAGWAGTKAGDSSWTQKQVNKYMFTKR